MRIKHILIENYVLMSGFVRCITFAYAREWESKASALLHQIKILIIKIKFTKIKTSVT